MDAERAEVWRALAASGVELDIARVEPLGDGVKSEVQRVVLGDGRQLAFKRYRPEHALSAVREIAALELLAAREDLPVPALVASSSTATGGADDFVLVELLPGRLLREIAETLDEDGLRAIYTQIGAFQRALHETHAARFGELVPAAGESHAASAAALSERFDAALHEFYGNGGSRRLGSQCAAFFRDRERALAECTEPVLLHMDCHEANVLVVREPGGELRITGVIDFDCAIAGDPMLDLAKSQLLSPRWGQVTLDGLLEGYGELPGDWRTRFDVALVLHALVLRNWYTKNVSRAGEVHTERRIRRLLGDPGLVGSARRLISPRRV